MSTRLQVERKGWCGVSLRRISLALACSGLVSYGSPALAGTIGYVVLGSPGSTSPETAITAAGHTPLSLGTLAGANLANVDVLWILNPSNSGYAADLTSSQAAVNAFVANGGTLLFHDRRVTEASTVIPGASAITFVRDFTDDAEIQTTSAAPDLLDGPGGVITDDTLDGGNSSSHGYALVATLPDGTVVTLTRTDPNHAVDVHYAVDGGHVYYSTIPLDFYLGGASDFAQIYAVNLAAYIFNLTGGAGAVPTPVQHVQQPVFWNAAGRMGDIRHRLANMPGSGRDRVLAAYGPIKLAAAGPVSLGANSPSAGDLFVEVSGSDNFRDAHGTLNGFKSSTESITVGYQKALRRDLSVGFAFGYDDTRSDTSGAVGKSSSELYGLSAFGRKYLSDLNAAKATDWYVDGVFGVRSGEIDISRGSGISGDTDALQGLLSVSLGAEYVVNDTLTLSPYAGTQYVHTTISGFTESGAGALEYGSQETSQWEAFLGGRLAKSFQAGPLDLTASAALEVHQALDQRNPDLNAGLAGIGGTTSRIAMHDLPETYASAKLGLQFSTGRKVAGYLDLSGYSSENGSADGYSVAAGVRVSF